MSVIIIVVSLEIYIQETFSVAIPVELGFIVLFSFVFFPYLFLSPFLFFLCECWPSVLPERFDQHDSVYLLSESDVMWKLVSM